MNNPINNTITEELTTIDKNSSEIGKIFVL